MQENWCKTYFFRKKIV